MQSFWSVILFLGLVLFFTFLLACDDGEDPDESFAEQCEEILSRGDPYPELPDCGSFPEQDGWFDIPDFHEVTEDFPAQEEPAFIPCTAGLDGDQLQVTCDDWHFHAVWIEPGRSFPLTDGQTIYAFANELASADAAFATRCQLWVIDETGETLFYQTDYYLSDYWDVTQVGDHEIHFGGEMSCQYRGEQNQPALPESNEKNGLCGGWYYVVGHSAEGSLDGSVWSISRPGLTAMTDDQRFHVIYPYSYSHHANWLEEPAIDGISHQLLLQVVRTLD